MINGLAFRVLHWPRPSSTRTFVLVHGIGVSHKYFRPLYELLAQTDEVFALDLPGYAGLPKPDHSPDVPEMARALAAVLDRLGIADAVIVGHSMGTQWVVELALQRPDLASHVVAIGPVTDDHHRSALAQAVALGLDTFHETPRANAIVYGEYLRAGPRWYLAQLPHMLSYPIEERVQALTRPLLIMRGGRDPIAGVDWCRRLRDRAADAALVFVPGSGHLAQYRRPRAVAAAIDAFLRVRPAAVPPDGPR